MVLWKLISKRLPHNANKFLWPRIELSTAAKSSHHRQDFSDVAERGLNSRSFIHRTAIRNYFPEFLCFPAGEKLREKLRLVNATGNRLQLTGLNPPPPPPLTETRELPGVSIDDARKIFRLCQMEKLKARLREIPTISIPLSEFAQICVHECGNKDQGAEFAKTLDKSGNVIVLGNIVFLNPKQVAKLMESIIPQSDANPNDPRKKTLEAMEKQKAMIDEKAKAQTRIELYCGLGFLTAQTAGFMRLTFWELSWDVMEPICFFTTSLYFGLAYVFFMKTSVEPSFEGYFCKRFEAKQSKLMELQGFNVDKYKELCRVFRNPNSGNMMKSRMWESF
ncbi:Calcium uniporter protein 4, mitochondrial [Linum perenne]